MNNRTSTTIRNIATRTRIRSMLVRIKRVLLISTAALVCTSGMGAATTPVSEYAVKAAVLFKVSKFVEWPASSFGSERASFVICVVGTQAALQAFEDLESKHLGTHPIDVRRVTGDTLDLRQCHVAFFPNDGGADVDYALSKLAGMPVLTVGETEEFATRGGILALVTREQRVGFTVNLPNSKRSKLTISSQLLHRATVIEADAR